MKKALDADIAIKINNYYYEHTKVHVKYFNHNFKL